MLKCLFFIALSAAATAQAGVLSEAMITGQPQQFLKSDGTVEACGARLFGMTIPTSERETIQGFDASFVFGLGAGMIKGGGFRGTIAEIAAKPASGGRAYAPSSMWIRAAGQPAPQRLGNIERGESKLPTIRYIVKDISPLMKLYSAILAGQVVQVGITGQHENLERVFYGKPTLTENDRDQMMSCLNELMRAAEALQEQISQQR